MKNLAQEAKAKAAMAEGKEEKRLEIITATLVELRSMTDELDLQKAELLQQVKNEKLYRVHFETFAKYCDAIGYHRSSAYRLIRAYEDPQIRNAYVKVGALKADQILRTKRKLQTAGVNQELVKEHTKDLLAFAEGHTGPEVKAECELVLEALEESPDIDAEDSKLTVLLKKKSALLEERAELEARIEEIEAELEKIEQEQDRLTQ